MVWGSKGFPVFSCSCGRRRREGCTFHEMGGLSGWFFFLGFVIFIMVFSWVFLCGFVLFLRFTPPRVRGPFFVFLHVDGVGWGLGVGGEVFVSYLTCGWFHLVFFTLLFLHLFRFVVWASKLQGKASVMFLSFVLIYPVIRHGFYFLFIQVDC